MTKPSTPAPSTHRRNLATELAALEQTANGSNVDLTFHRRLAPVAHWSIEAVTSERIAVDNGVPGGHMMAPTGVLVVTEVTFLDAISKIAAALSATGEDAPITPTRYAAQREEEPKP